MLLFWLAVWVHVSGLQAKSLPKQFIDLTGSGKTLIETFIRIQKVIHIENIFISTNEKYKGGIKQILR